MAKIGYLYPKISKITETESNGSVTEALGTGKALGKGVKMTTSVKTADAKLYADDGLAESSKEFISGSTSLEVDDMTEEIEADITGATYTSSENHEVSFANDIAPYFRLSSIARRVKNNVEYYIVVTYMRVQFGAPNDDYQTKGESLTYKTTSVTGELSRNCDGKWRDKQVFTSLSSALTYQNTMVNIS